MSNTYTNIDGRTYNAEQLSETVKVMAARRRALGMSDREIAEMAAADAAALAADQEVLRAARELSR